MGIERAGREGEGGGSMVAPSRPMCVIPGLAQYGDDPIPREELTGFDQGTVGLIDRLEAGIPETWMDLLAVEEVLRGAAGRGAVRA